MALLLLYVCTDSDIRFLIIDPQGNEEMGVGNGVSPDVYTSFPYVRYDIFKYEWEAIVKILH